MTGNTLTAEPAFSDVYERGRKIYETTLRAVLEPERNNEFVAIDPDTEEYVVARTSGDAMRAMYQLHPDARPFITKIGSEPDFGLAARVLAAEMRGRK